MKLLALTQFGIGFIVWTLYEYLEHRRIHQVQQAHHQCHHREARFRTGQKFFARGDELSLSEYLNMISVLVLAVVLGHGWWAAGWGAGIAVFGVLHWSYHRIELPFPTWYVNARVRHLAHHTTALRANFGITTSLWDHVFGTYQVAKAPRALTIPKS